MKGLHLILGIVLLGFLVFAGIPLIGAIIPFRIIEDTQGLNGCPDTVDGNYDADFTIKYFYSPDCFYCMGEEKIIEELVEEKGYLFRLERYDVNYCGNEAAEYEVGKTPSFVFVKDGVYSTKDGYLPKNALERTICKSTGGCF